MLLKVRLFAGLREAAGSDSTEVELEPGSTTAVLLDTLRDGSALGELLERLPVRVAVNSAYADDQRVLNEGDEIALVPPISGGSGIRARVTDQPLDLKSIAADAGDPAAGAVVIFQGVTREVPRLEYEAYVEMAEERIVAILVDCSKRFGLTGAIAEHRTGPVALGEPSVIVAVSSPHRGEAFAGAREAIDRIKAEAPVWKIEVGTDGVGHRVEGLLPEVDQAEVQGNPGGQKK
ncbi:MAG: molybdenum cofactor biosynthesis protein MoaE [Thermoleophilia bacterium]|nr:molybdenum cofactor biosynthesis protein MoaE [Thermoleophilia bacterium]